MEIHNCGIKGLALVELAVRKDGRGFFVERYRRSIFAAAGLPVDLVQDNHSRSEPGVLRGLHYQFSPPQGKLVGVLRGRIWDVVADIRPDSETFGQTYSVELSDVNGRLLWVPGGFAHGFCVLGDEPADVLYKTDAEYNSAGEGGISWSDPDFAIDWPIAEPIVSDRDNSLESFAEYRSRGVNWTL